MFCCKNISILVPRKSSILKESKREVRKGGNSNEDLFMSHNFIFPPAVHSAQQEKETEKGNVNVDYSTYFITFGIVFILSSLFTIYFQTSSCFFPVNF